MCAVNFAYRSTIVKAAFQHVGLWPPCWILGVRCSTNAHQGPKIVTIPHNSSEWPAFVVFLSLISWNQFCSESEYQMKLYESKHFVITVPMNEYFSPDKRWQSLLLSAGLSAKMLFNAKGRYNDISNSFHITLFWICHVTCWSVFHISFTSSLKDWTYEFKHGIAKIKPK